MSQTFTFSDTSSVLSSNFFPPIELEGDHEIGLLSLETYNSIPNVDSTNNLFHFDEPLKTIKIPHGTYEVKDIEKFIQEFFKKLTTKDKRYYLQLGTNDNTLQTSIKCTVPVDFSQENSIGSLLGFDKVKISAGIQQFANRVVDIFRINSIFVECNIASGSFLNGKASHTLYRFYPSSPAGYKLVETPTPVIYLPVTTRVIDNITLRIVDQEGSLVDFRKERITITLHLRKVL
jgi:hypothetical protein